jgi:formate hydrogenlyase subunit 6/NADH:ubiquinone oxidoreductase subunit I/flavodoxin
MKIVLVYISPNKTTQKITEELSKLFLKDRHEVIELDIGKKENRDLTNIDLDIFKDVDLIGVGSPVYHLNTLGPLSDFLEYALPKIKLLSGNVKAFIYLTYGGTSTGKSFINTVNLLRRNDVKLIGGFKIKAPHFWHLENFPYDESLKTVNNFYSTISKNGFAGIEWIKVKKMFSYQKLLVRLIYPFMGISIRLRGMPDIGIDTSKCIKCKKCSNECPVNAIEMNDYPTRNKDKCIHCYHCTTLCPNGAVIFNVNDAIKRVEKNKSIIGLEYPENAIYC